VVDGYSFCNGKVIRQNIVLPGRSRQKVEMAAFTLKT